jgi:hypothetical protein
MTAKNEFEKDAQVSTTPKDDDALSPDAKRELTDQEIAAVAGGVAPISSAVSGAGKLTNTIPTKAPSPLSG